jgi:N-acetylglutamate synthase-like GNAT family acetyltransferase
MAGERSYLVAEAGGHIIGVAGYQVENLITRMDEFFILPEAPYAAVAVPMLAQVEEASRDLQSEVGFIFVPRTAPPAQLQAFLDQGYERIEIEMLKVPAWREAAQELQSPEKQILMKKLRAERVLRPV